MTGDRLNIYDETEIKKNSVVIQEKKYVCNEHGFKVKRALKYMYVSIFDSNIGTVKKAETKRNQPLGLQDPERNLLDVIYPQKEPNTEIENNELDEEGTEDLGNVNQWMLTLDG